jgi:hypothetical protein
MNDHPGRQDGQAVPLVAGLVAVAAVLLLAVGHLGRRAADAARARTAADAAALAGAALGRSGAASMAAANGGVLVSYANSDGTVRVTVTVGGESATARAAMVADDQQSQAAPP